MRAEALHNLGHRRIGVSDGFGPVQPVQLEPDLPLDAGAIEEFTQPSFSGLRRR